VCRAASHASLCVPCRITAECNQPRPSHYGQLPCCMQIETNSSSDLVSSLGGDLDIGQSYAEVASEES
jgi:hypothetical protein